MAKLVIIDGNSIINRAYYAIPPLYTKDGTPTNAVHGFLKMLLLVINEKKPEYLVVAFDVKGGNFRHKLYKDYKGTRKGMDDELALQLPILKEILDQIGVARLELKNYEADDLIGTVSDSMPSDIDVLIVSGDKDMLQLVNDNVRVLITKRGTSDLKEFDYNEVKNELGVFPDQVTDYKGIRGDSSDNIPGVRGIGEKGATTLLNNYKSLEEVYENIDRIASKRNKKLLIEQKEMAFLSKKLAEINKNAPIDYKIDDFVLKLDLDSSADTLKKYELNSFIRQTSDLKKESVKLSDTYTDDVSKLDLTKEMIIDIFDYKEKSFYAFKQDDIVITDDISFLKGKTININGFNVKDIIVNLSKKLEVKLKIANDLKILNYILYPDKNSDELEKYSLDYKLDTFKEITEKFKLDIDVAEPKIKSLLSKRVNLIDLLIGDYKSKIIEKGLESLYNDIELPLIPILADIQMVGFKVDLEFLDKFDSEISEKLKLVEDKIYFIAGEEFNINSTKQLGVVLFEKLKLPVIKKTKTGYSTSKETLAKLMDTHEIIDHIMDYRTLSKLKSTYIDGIRKVVDDDGKVRSSLNQAIVVTGRLSSTEPNLQNIPIRFEEGRRVRKIFVPSSDKHILVSADYSQIELRVLAHISGDENMMKAYGTGEDIHKITAAKIFDVSLDEVNTDMRRRAKAVNFGIVYGKTDYGLSEELEIPVYEAKDFIEKYFEEYPGIKEYMDSTVEFCIENGYVKTLAGRIREINDIHAKNFHTRNFAKRAAMNTPIQGTAADIIKIAMIDVYRELNKRKLKSKLILQVHDELIIDTLISEKDEVIDILTKKMENAFKLNVPLKVNVSSGSSWYETK